MWLINQLILDLSCAFIGITKCETDADLVEIISDRQSSQISVLARTNSSNGPNATKFCNRKKLV